MYIKKPDADKSGKEIEVTIHSSAEVWKKSVKFRYIIIERK